MNRAPKKQRLEDDNGDRFNCSADGVDIEDAPEDERVEIGADDEERQLTR